MSEIQIRPTIAGDISRLMALDHTDTSEFVWQLELRRENKQVTATFREVRLPRAIPVAYPHDPSALVGEWTRKSMVYTALASQIPIGYISLMERKSASVVWVNDLVVGMESRRKGVASRLLGYAHDWASSRNAKRIILEMQAKNQAAIRLAQKYGYEFCGYNDRYYSTQDVALFFSKTLK